MQLDHYRDYILPVRLSDIKEQPNSKRLYSNCAGVFERSALCIPSPLLSKNNTKFWALGKLGSVDGVALQGPPVDSRQKER